MKVKTTIERSKKNNFYLIVYDLIRSGRNPATISQKLHISKQRINYYISKLKEEGLITKVGYGTWEVKKEVKKFSLGMKADKPKTNLHALQIKIPIIKGKINDTQWIVKNKLKNWTPKYLDLNVLGGLTVRNNNNNSITVFAKSRDLPNIDEVDNLSFKIKAFIGDYFRKQGVILDLFNTEVKNLNLATEDKQSKSMIKKGEKYELNLNKRAEQIFNKDNIQGKAWIDGSPYTFSAETNDKEWKRYYLAMPFLIRDMFTLQESTTSKLCFMAENQRSHAKAIKELCRLAENINKVLEVK